LAAASTAGPLTAAANAGGAAGLAEYRSVTETSVHRTWVVPVRGAAQALPGGLRRTAATV